MTKWFWKKLSLYIGWIATIVLFALAIFSANIEIKDLDLWLHLASGRYIIEHLQIPHVDVFSATVAGKPWINHEWLFQVIVSSVYELGGTDSLITLQVAVVGITFLLLFFLGYHDKRQVVPLWTLLLVVLVYQLRFFLRPDIFSLLFFVLYITVLSLMLQTRASLWIMLILQILWVNIHGFFIFGPLLVFFNVLAEWIKRHIYLPFEWNDVGRLTEEEYARLKQILGVVILASFVNPYFIKGALYPLQVLFSLGEDSRIFFEHISELQKPFNSLQSFLNFENYTAYKALIVISVVTFILNIRRIDIGILLFWLFFLIFSMSAARNVSYFAFVSYFVILANSQNIHTYQFLAPQFDNVRFKSICSLTMKVILIAVMLQYIQARALRGYYDFDNYERKSEHGGLSLRNYPYKAVDFLVQNDVKGNFFNDFNSGAYLIGRTTPDIKVYIDGRTELYGGKFFERYNKIWKGDAALWDEAIEQYDLTGAFLNYVYVPAPAKTIRYLYFHPDWKLVYFDYDAAIFLRNVPENARLIKEFAIDLSQWQTEHADLMKIKAQPVRPYRYINRAYALFNLGFLDKAKEEAQEALDIYVSDFNAYKILGMIALKEKRYAEGLQLIRSAKILNPGDKETRYYLAKAFYHAGDLETAQHQLTPVLEANPRNDQALYLMARIFDKRGMTQEAQTALQKVREVVGGDEKALQRLGEDFE